MKAGALICFFCLVNLQASGSYFQQEVRYKIEVTLNDVSHTLDGKLELSYVNRSPDTLHELYFHLWPNAYSENTSALVRQQVQQRNVALYFAPDSLRGAISGLAFRVNGMPASHVADSLHADICKLVLAGPLPPGDSLVVTTPFRVKLPHARYSRLGHDGQAYFISQWFPKPAVYDQEGWHAMPYLHLGEFYGEFGSFEVHITLPENYVIGATGNRVSREDAAFMDRRALMTGKEGGIKFPASAAKMKTVTFRQDRVHDFAWFADKRYKVRKGSVQLNSGREVTTWVLYLEKNAKEWEQAVSYLDNAIEFYSEQVGEYPYDQCTVVEGMIGAGTGMEYPGITVISTPPNAYLLEEVIVHEVGHNWFYGILGSNERDHPWMDEGINSYYELRYFEWKHAETETDHQHRLFGLGNLAPWIVEPDSRPRDDWTVASLVRLRTRRSQAPNLPAADYTPINYGLDVYTRGALLFDCLRAYLGTELFDSCMQRYFEAWKFRHPGPEDLEAVFESVSGQDLDWFFHGLLADSAGTAYRVRAVKRKAGKDGRDGYEVTLRNRGGHP